MPSYSNLARLSFDINKNNTPRRKKSIVSSQVMEEYHETQKQRRYQEYKERFGL